MKTYEQRTQSILQKAQAQKIKRTKRITTLSICAGALAAVLAVNLVLFVPYEVGGVNIDAYRSSEYFPLIERLSTLSYSPHKTNNFNELIEFLNMFGCSSDKGGDADIPTADGSSEGYDDVTLNQTENVTEGDLFKRNADCIFYLGYKPSSYNVVINETENGSEKNYIYVQESYELRAYTIDGENSKQVSAYEISPEKGTSFSGYDDDREMFVSEDGKSVTVLSPCYDGDAGVLYTVVIRLDVSDAANITETSRIYISGNYVSARVADGSLLVISDFGVPRNVDFSNEAMYIPQIGARGALENLPATDIIVPDDASSASYTVICAVDFDSLEPTDAVALLSYSDDVYVSQNNLFATRGYTSVHETENEHGLVYTLDNSEIRIVSYGDGQLESKGSVTVTGNVLNRYCLDEYDGVLRAFTTATYRATDYTYKGDDPYEGVFPAETCNLYCFDLDTLERIASEECFAPVGESVKSARFYGDTAYVCTAEINYDSFNVVITDPVFAFDLSDYGNITYKDTGTIPGYSLSLAEFKDGTLIGIGYGELSTTLKIELYTQTESTVSSVAQYELLSVRFSPLFKAHFIDKNNGLVGLCVNDAMRGSTEYKLLRYDGYEFVEIISEELTTAVGDARATYIDGYVYVFGGNDFFVAAV